MDSRQKIGAVLADRYEILGELGEGGFGTVYKARQLATGQLVAIKVLQLGSKGTAQAQAREKRVARFQREMQLCGQLHHPNIVRLVDSGRADEAVVYSVFSYVPGKDLAHVIAEEGPLDPREARHFMLQILDALGCAHAQGVIHRDLKPANIAVIPTGARRNVLVLDFGVGAQMEEAGRDEETRLTQTNESVGTPAYAAPEQLRGQPPTPRSDLYSWGLVFLECLTGKRAIAGDTAADVIYSQLSADPVPIPAAILEHPLGDILRRATAKDAAARNVTTEGLLRELEECDVSGLRSRSAPARLQRAAPDMRTATVELARERNDGGLSRELVEGERRQITAVCCILTASSTARGPADTEGIDQLLGLQQEACTMIARRFNGHAVGVLGDRVLFYFGYPTAREDAARRAAEAAREMVADLLGRRGALEAERKVRIDLRVGIHTGLVIARELRDPTIAGIGYVVGATPKLAALLSEAAEPGSVLVSGETQRLLRKHFALEEDGSRPLAGFEEPVEVFRLREGSASGGLRGVPLVGRARELDVLLERWGRVRGGAGQAILITGEPGIGKSRLARELEEKIRDEPHTWLESRCTPDSVNSAFYPIVDLLDRLADPRREATPEDKADQLEAMLSLHGFDLGEVMPLLAPLLSLPLSTQWAPLDVSPQKQRELTRNAVLSLLFEMAEKKPIALFIEDLHWADPSTLELLGQLVGEVGSARVLAIFTARPELPPSWSPTAALQIQLERLGPPEVEQMAMTITGGRALPAEVLDTIAGRTDGVPLFVEELVLAMIEAGALVEQEGCYALAKPLSEMAIPGTLRDLLVARLDRLGRAKETAQVAAAIGREFTFELLRAVSLRSEAEVQGDLDKLVAAELVHRKRRLRSAAYLFKHALVRDSAYESMLKRSRQQVHARVAKALEESFAEVVSERPDLLAHHHAEAEQKREAIGYAQKAALTALRRSAYAEARGQVSQALLWIEAIDDPTARTVAELELNSLLMPVLMATTSYGSTALKALGSRTLELSDALGTSPHTFPTLYALVIYHHMKSERAKSLELAERLVNLAREAGDASQELAAHAVLAQCFVMAGRIEEGRAAAERVLVLHDPTQHREMVLVYGLDPKAFAHIVLGLSLALLGYLDRGKAELGHAVAWARELNQPNMLSLSLFFSATVYRLRGEPERVLEVTGESIAIADRYGLPFNRAYAGLLRGWATKDVAEVSRILDAHKATGQVAAMPYYLSILAEAEAAHGMVTEAIGHLDEALRFSEEHADNWFRSGVLRLKGTFLLLKDPGAVGLAEECLRRAIDVAQLQRARTEELDATAELARLLRDRGRRREAHELLSAVRGWFSEGFETKTLEHAQRLLDELAQ
ncbi:TOMM system kinase/cyclase fusion protein [Sorangium sp. So ce131]|uniref:TOMM system kinase/cyclase fusion protein n=1 Tax=Sorangium sp. So ce131 TaxID=3133282 RepID=UPI003F63C359